MTAYAYADIMSVFFQSNRYHWDGSAQAAYLSITNANPTNDMFVSYDDPRATQAKVSYVRNQKLGGLMIWALGQDYESGQPEPLLQSIKLALATPGGGFGLTQNSVPSLDLATPGGDFVVPMLLGPEVYVVNPTVLLNASSVLNDAGRLPLGPTKSGTVVVAVTGMQANDKVDFAGELEADAGAAIELVKLGVSATVAAGQLSGTTGNGLWRINGAGLLGVLATHSQLAAANPAVTVKAWVTYLGAG
jgi:hypothetical protein